MRKRQQSRKKKSEAIRFIDAYRELENIRGEEMGIFPHALIVNKDELKYLIKEMEAFKQTINKKVKDLSDEIIASRLEIERRILEEKRDGRDL